MVVPSPNLYCVTCFNLKMFILLSQRYLKYKCYVPTQTISLVISDL